MKKKRLIIGSIFFLIIIFLLYISTLNNIKTSSRTIRYSVIGDSYSNGEGATPEESWPALLTAHLNSAGIPIELISNPSVTGWTSQQAIDEELPQFIASKPIFATLLIGVNDWVQGISPQTFEKNLIYLVDHMQTALPDKQNLVLVTIPDFAVTSVGKEYLNGRNGEEGIATFNGIIKREALKRNLTVVDIFELSKEMGKNTQLVSGDGLHPSAKEYAVWETNIYSAVQSLFKGFKVNKST